MTDVLAIPVVEVPPTEQEAGPLWRQSLRLIWRNRRATLMPLVVIQLPLSVVAAVSWAFLLGRVFTGVPVDQPTALANESPNTLLACLFAWSWIYALFTLVGVGGSMVGVKSLVQGRAGTLAEALDRPFTRLGAMMASGAILYLVFIVGLTGAITVVAPVAALFVLLKLGLVFQLLLLDDESLRGAIKKSWSLQTRNLLRFASHLLTIVPVAAVTMLVAIFIFTLLSAPFIPANPGRSATIAINSLGIGFFGLAMIPIGTYFATITTLYYLKLRSDQHA